MEEDISYVVEVYVLRRWKVIDHVHSTVELCREVIDKDTTHKIFRIKEIRERQIALITKD